MSKHERVATVLSRVNRLSDLVDVHQLERSEKLEPDLAKLTVGTLDHLDTVLAQSEMCVKDVAAKVAERDKKPAPSCDPQVLRALRAELHQHAGGHQPPVQADVAKLGTVAARVILTTLRELRSKNNTMRSQPWRNVR